MGVDDSARPLATTANPGPPFEPMALNRPVIAARSALKVAVLNAAGGANLEEIVACLRRPPLADVGTLLLCEASWHMPRHRLVEFAPALAAALKMSFAFLPSFGRARSDGGFRAFGNAILCAQPIEQFHAISLPKPPNKSRQGLHMGIHQALVAGINVDGHRVSLGVAHLERVWDPAGRSFQMKCFLEGIGKEERVIIGGDFNTTSVDMDRRWAIPLACLAVAFYPWRFRRPEPYEPLFDRMKEHGFSIDGANVPAAPTFTFTGVVPPLWRPKLDWIAARGIEPVNGSAAVVPARTAFLGRRLSDHNFVLCEFRL